MDGDGRFYEDNFGLDEEGGFQGYHEDFHNDGVVNSDEEDEDNVRDDQQQFLHDGEENYVEDFVNEGQDDDFAEEHVEDKFKNVEDEFENGEDEFENGEEESPVQEVEGSKPGTTLYMDVGDHYVYRIQKTSGARYNMRCRISVPGNGYNKCGVKRRLRRLKAHDHDPPENIEAEVVFRKRLYERAATETIPLSQIHSEGAAK